VLAARFAGYAPERVVAVIAANAGHYDPVGLDTIQMSDRAAVVPQKVIASSGDAVSGTRRPYDYFRRHLDRGAPWVFAVQNGVPHCCVINARTLVIDWLEQVAIPSLAGKGPIVRSGGYYGFFETTPSVADDCPARGAAN